MFDSLQHLVATGIFLMKKYENEMDLLPFVNNNFTKRSQVIFQMNVFHTLLRIHHCFVSGTDEVDITSAIFRTFE